MAWVHRLSKVDTRNKTGVCSNCGPVKLHKKGNGRLRCAKFSNETRRIGRFKEKYGLDIQAVDVPVACELCGGKTRIAYDHDHKTGKHRGWLCMKCNTALGLVNDDIKLLQKMIDYLKW